MPVKTNVALQQRFIDFGDFRVEHFYLCDYIPQKVKFDELSSSLLRFKSGAAPDVDAWVGCAVDELVLALQIPLLVVRALGSFETTSGNDNGAPLDGIGGALSEKIGAAYQPWRLGKRLTRPLKGLSRSERFQEMEGAYSFDGTGACQNVLVVDDVFTTGQTLRSIARAILDVMPATIQCFTLASTGENTPTKVKLHGGGYQWQDVRWSMVAEADVGLPSEGELIKRIRSNFD